MNSARDTRRERQVTDGEKDKRNDTTLDLVINFYRLPFIAYAIFTEHYYLITVHDSELVTVNFTVDSVPVHSVPSSRPFLLPL